MVNSNVGKDLFTIAQILMAQGNVQWSIVKIGDYSTKTEEALSMVESLTAAGFTHKGTDRSSSLEITRNLEYSFGEEGKFPSLLVHVVSEISEQDKLLGLMEQQEALQAKIEKLKGLGNAPEREVI